GWAVTMLELVGGALLVLGLFSRVVAALLIANLIGAIIYVSGEVGLIAAEGVGYERDLAYIASFIGVMLLGPGRPSLDHAFGIEKHIPALVPPEGSTEGSRASLADRREARA
ncbi:MAG: DoxX family protein, partial [Actinomycetota bacterium]|nr:DoxX family protein [Actinomycetota bacterium]